MLNIPIQTRHKKIAISVMLLLAGAIGFYFHHNRVVKSAPATVEVLAAIVKTIDLPIEIAEVGSITLSKCGY